MKKKQKQRIKNGSAPRRGKRESNRSSSGRRRRRGSGRARSTAHRRGTRQEVIAEATAEERKTAERLVKAPGVIVDGRVLEAHGWGFVKELGVVITVGDEACRAHGTPGWPVSLDDVRESNEPPPWLKDETDGAEARFSDEIIRSGPETEGSS